MLTLKNILFRVIILFLCLFFYYNCILAENLSDRILYTVTMVNNSKFTISQDEIRNHIKLNNFIYRKSFTEQEIINNTINQKLFLHYIDVVYGNIISEDQVTKRISDIEAYNNLNRGDYERLLKSNGIEFNQYRELIKFILAKEQYFMQNHSIQNQDIFLQLLFAKENKNLIKDIEDNFKLGIKILDMPKIEAYKITFHKKDLKNLKAIIDKNNKNDNLAFLNKIPNIKIEHFNQEITKYKNLVLCMNLKEYSKPIMISKDEMEIYYIANKTINLDNRIVNILMHSIISRDIENRFTIFILDLKNKVIISKI